MPTSTKLSQLPTISSLTLSDLAVIIQAAGPVDSKITMQNLINFLGGNGSTPYKFFAYRNAAYTIPAGTFVFDTELYDTGNNYNNATGVFTAPVTGFYRVNTNISATFASSGTAVGETLYKNATALISHLLVSTYNSSFVEGIPMAPPPIALTAGDTMTVQSAVPGAAAAIGSSPIYSFFGVEFIGVT